MDTRTDGQENEQKKKKDGEKDIKETAVVDIWERAKTEEAEVRRRRSKTFWDWAELYSFCISFPE